jgi:phosphoribosyl-ATP pyrophosphohydrolase/phosphoribosyl-AMP cyclohydrolase
MTIASFDIDSADFAKGGGLVTVVAQDQATGEVLMVAHADREALALTIETGEMHYRSRTRGLWRKGATSGNVQRVVSLTLDCDGDAVLARVIPAGPACHSGDRSCFPTDGPADVFSRLDAIIVGRLDLAPGDRPSYTRKLLSDRNLRLKKIGEEASELVVAAADGDRTRAVEEAADLMYHTLVVLRAMGAGVVDLARALERRE